MNFVQGAILTIAASMLAACATQQLDCSGPRDDCEENILGDCRPLPVQCLGVEPGASFKLVDIDASPTPAAIYLNGEFIGRTPLRYPLSFTSQSRYMVIVAEPLYPTQARQERRMLMPPLPDRIQFYMNNPQETEQQGQ